MEIEEVDIDLVEPNDYNPNEMDPAKFALLTKDVEEQGMDQPVVCRPHPEKEGHWIIVDGEHRWRNARAAGTGKVLISKKN